MLHLIKKKLGGIARFVLVICHFTLPAAFTACASFTGSISKPALGQPIGVNADPDTLLKTLADLAREGESALCNATHLAKKLNINIAAPRIVATEKSRVILSEVGPRDLNMRFPAGNYRIFSNKETRSCYLYVDLGRVLFCKANTIYVQGILEKNVEYTSPYPGRSTQGIFFSYSPKSGGVSTLRLGTSENECVYGFSLSTEVVIE